MVAFLGGAMSPLAFLLAAFFVVDTLIWSRGPEVWASVIGAGDEVITTALTFCATVNTIIHAGAKPVLVDVDPVTFNIDPDEVAAKITSRTKAIVPVHFAGRPCDMDALVTIAQRHGLMIIEDSAHAVETTYKGKQA